MVDHAGAAAGPLLVVAGAGTGKTKTLAHCLARLVGQGADPERILLLTFTRRAAHELGQRALHVAAHALEASRGSNALKLPWAGTFHSAGARLLRHYAERIGLAPGFTIHDRADSQDLMALVRATLTVDLSERRFPSPVACMAIYSRSVNAGETVAEVLLRDHPRHVPWQAELEALFRCYVEAKQAHDVLDFDDLLLWWAAMLDETALRDEIDALFDHVLVDEYQDTNRLQARILRMLRPDGRGCIVVGDDAQAIYSFRAADVRNILDFPHQYAPEAKVLPLTVNYRSLQPILDTSNALIAQACERHEKALTGIRPGGERPLLVGVRDESGQARYVAERVLQFREAGMQLRDQAVLFRSSSHSAPLELELARRRIPFVKYGGLKFLEAAHVKDVLALLRWISNPRDRLAAFRSLRLVPGIGPANANRIVSLVASDGSLGANPPASLDAIDIPPPARDAWAGLAALHRELSLQPAWPVELAMLLDWYRPQLHRLHEDAAAREEDLEQLARIAATFDSRERFLTEVTLDPPSSSGVVTTDASQDDDYLILSTIHSAKGQEWRSVQVLNVVDGCMPSDRASGREALDEERRLLYVAMTRARDHLALVAPHRFHVTQQSRTGDRYLTAARSRFLTRQVCATLDERSWPPAEQERKLPDAVPSPALDLARRMRQMWRGD